MGARLGLVVLGILAALGLGEVGLRVAARVDSRIRLLATGRAVRPEATYATLEAFIAAQSAHITPHRAWFNYWSNAFGFHDEEFVEPKPPGRYRILAVGDSFTFGLVPYPEGVMTRTEAGLRAACGGRDIDLLNMGVMGAGAREYRTVVELSVARFTPDLVLVNLFVGNDVPDLHRQVHDRSPVERALRRSYVWTFGRNVVRLRGGPRNGRPPLRPGQAGPPGAVPRGGAVVDAAAGLALDDPELVGPMLADGDYRWVLAFDLARLYRPADERDLHEAWQPVLRDLDGLRAAAGKVGASIVLAVMPSVLQVDAALRSETVARISTWYRFRGLSEAQIDPQLPNVVLAEYARSRGLPYVDLTPAFAAAYALETRDPLYKIQDNHWTPRGNHVAATALADSLARLVCPRRAEDHPSPRRQR